MKHCPTCDTDKPATTEYFYAEKGRRGDGLAGRCKECQKAKNRRYWKETYYPAHADQQKQAVTERRRERKREQE